MSPRATPEPSVRSEPRTDAPDVGLDLTDTTLVVPSASTALLEEILPDPRDEQAALERQARELGEHLTRRQQDLDHRQAQLNAQLAEHDKQLRAARLWFDARKQEVDDRELERSLARQEREQQLDEREKTLAARAEAFDLREQRLEARSAEIDARQQEFTARQQRLDSGRHAEEVQLREGRERLAREMADLGGRADEQSRRFAQVQRDQQTRSEWLERRTAELDDREQQLVEAEEELSVRQCQWAEADLLLAESRREVERMTEELEGHRQEQMTELTAARRQWVEEQRHREAELTRRQEALERHAEQLDHRRAVLEQSQQDVTALHREALEMRLATEELWAQLTGAVPPAELHEALGETRARLAGHYRLASAEIEARKAELQALRDDLAAQHDRLREQVAESEAWAAGRLDELRQREAAIESSRAELEKLRTEQQRQFAQWRGQRERWEFERRHWMLEQHSGAPPGPHLPALGAPGEVSMTLGRQQAAHLNM